MWWLQQHKQVNAAFTAATTRSEEDFVLLLVRQHLVCNFEE
jgi:hypothetical protein